MIVKNVIFKILKLNIRVLMNREQTKIAIDCIRIKGIIRTENQDKLIFKSMSSNQFMYLD